MPGANVGMTAMIIANLAIAHLTVCDLGPTGRNARPVTLPAAGQLGFHVLAGPSEENLRAQASKRANGLPYSLTFPTHVCDPDGLGFAELFTSKE